MKLQCVTVDCTDVKRVAEFWHALLGGTLESEGTEYWIDFKAGGPDILFLQTPDKKSGKNRLHFDLRPTDQAAEVERALALGATHVDIGQTGDESWVVLADPEGNEFCILRALA